MIPAIRGTHDILPGDVERWQRVEATARRVFERYGYAELRTPIIEREELFAKGTGETTDIAKAHPEVVKQLAAGLDQARTAGSTRK